MHEQARRLREEAQRARDEAMARYPARRARPGSAPGSAPVSMTGTGPAGARDPAGRTGPAAGAGRTGRACAAAAGWPGTLDFGTLRDLERVAVQFTSELRKLAMQSSATGENVISDLRAILEEALDRVKSEIFGSGREAPGKRGPGSASADTGPARHSPADAPLADTGPADTPQPTLARPTPPRPLIRRLRHAARDSGALTPRPPARG